MSGPLGRIALRAGMAAARHLTLKPLLAAAQRPRETQARVLQRILDANRDTSFGVRHGFARVDRVATWRQAVPVQGFEDLRPWVERQAETGEPCLTAEPPVMYNLTSGTTGKPKLIPVTRDGVRRVRREQRAFASALHAFDSSLLAGSLVGIGARAIEGRLPSGVPFGSVTGIIYREMPAAVRARYVLPAEVFDIADHDARYRAIATLLMGADDVTFATTANPSTFLRLLALINERLDPILADLSAGALSFDAGLSRSAHEALRRRLRARPDRAVALERKARSGAGLRLADIWPHLRGIGTWTGGSCRVALDALRPHLAPETRVIEVGYAASEFRGTINVEPARNLCLPMLHDVFFEFADAASGVGDARMLGLEEIEEGMRYRLFVTTADGLYRYDMNDIVEVAGRIGETPALAFVQKGRGVTNITGEKLYESQVSEALSAACSESGVRPVFYLALADETTSSYRVYVELEGEARPAQAMSHGLDRALAARNLEYRDKRASGRLRAPRAIMLKPGAALAYRRHCVASGQRESQFKLMPLRYAREVDFDFAPWSVVP